jgi:hypothetical protein
MNLNFSIASLLVACALFVAGQTPGATSEPVSQGEVPVVLTLSDATPFGAILRIAKGNRVPLGIIGGERPALCAEQKSIRIQASNFHQAFKQALVDTGYTVAFENGAYVLTGPDVTEREAKILHFRFDRFTATGATMNDASQLLNGYIQTSIDGASGFAFDTLFGSKSKFFTLRLVSVTTQEIANQIVQQDGKGLWVFRPTPPPIGPAIGMLAPLIWNPPIHIYGYDEDANEIDRLPCYASVGAKQ